MPAVAGRAAKDTSWRESGKVPSVNKSQLFGEEGDTNIRKDNQKIEKLKAKAIKVKSTS